MGTISAEELEQAKREDKASGEIIYRTRLVRQLAEEAADPDLAARTLEIEKSIIKKFRRPVWRQFTKAVHDYQLIQEGDKIVAHPENCVGCTICAQKCIAKAITMRDRTPAELAAYPNPLDGWR